MQNVKDIEQALELWVEENDGWRELPSRRNPETIEGIEGVVYQIDDFGGEGQGDQVWIIVEILQLDGEARTYRKEGYYASHEGFYWDGNFSEVRPVEKVITVWE